MIAFVNVSWHRHPFRPDISVIGVLDQISLGQTVIILSFWLFTMLTDKIFTRYFRTYRLLSRAKKHNVLSYALEIAATLVLGNIMTYAGWYVFLDTSRVTHYDISKPGDVMSFKLVLALPLG